jgi:hypothetical protein
LEKGNAQQVLEFAHLLADRAVCYAELLSSMAHVQVPTYGFESTQCIQRKFLLGMQHGALENLTAGLQNMLIASGRQLFNLD